MSPSPEPGPDKGSEPASAILRIEAPPGVGIEVTDATLNMVASGLHGLELSLPEGVYAIHFAAAGVGEEKVVNLRAAASPMEIRGGEFSLPSASPSLESTGSDLEQAQAQAVVQFADKSRRAPHKTHAQELVVFVRAPDARTRSDVARSIRLLNGNAQKMRSDLEQSDMESADEPAQGWAARSYSVPAGCYTLRYESSSRRIVEQTVCVFPGRRTFAYLKYGSNVQAERRGDGYRNVRRRGVDPTQTVLITALEDVTAPDAEALRQADILLYAIRSPTTPLDPGLVAALLQDAKCPYFKLYAAAALLARIELTEDSSLRDRLGLSRGERSSGLASIYSQDAVRTLLDSLPSGEWPDSTSMSWRLAQLARLPALGQLQAPPMLDCSWRWASACSIDLPGALPEGGTFEAAARARESAAPWLVWRASADRLKSPQNEPELDLDRALQAVAAQLPSTTPTEPIADPVAWSQVFHSLSPDTRQTANAVQVLAKGPDDAVDPRALASLLGAPASALTERLVSAADELAALPPASDA